MFHFWWLQGNKDNIGTIHLIDYWPFARHRFAFNNFMEVSIFFLFYCKFNSLVKWHLVHVHVFFVCFLVCLQNRSSSDIADKCIFWYCSKSMLSACNLLQMEATGEMQSVMGLFINYYLLRDFKLQFGELSHLGYAAVQNSRFIIILTSINDNHANLWYSMNMFAIKWPPTK